MAVAKAKIYQAPPLTDFHQGAYGDTFFVTAKPGGTNKWGVKNPVGHDLRFDYQPADLGAGFIKNSQTNARVCGATMSNGGANWPVPDARELPQVFNMAAKNQRDFSAYLEKTLGVAYDETAKIAVGLKATTEQVDTLAKGVESDGFAALKQRSERLGAALSGLEEKKQKSDQDLDGLNKTLCAQRQALGELQEQLDAEKARHQQAKDDGLVLQSDLKNVQAKFDALQEEVKQLKSGQQKHDEELKKKCECTVQ